MSGSKAAFDALMARREIVFHRPSKHWQNGLAVGNGDLGSAVYGPHPDSDGAVGITLNKVDIWDLRYDRAGATYHTVSELRELINRHKDTPEGREMLRAIEPFNVVNKNPNWIKESYPYAYSPPTLKPAGMVRIGGFPSYATHKSTLSIHRASVEIELGGAQAGAGIVVWADANSNVLVTRVTRRGKQTSPIWFELARYRDPQLGQPEVGYDESGLWHTYVFPDGFVYGMYAVVRSGRVAATERREGVWRDVEARIRMTPQGHEIMEVPLEFPELAARMTLDPSCDEAVLYVGVATSAESDDPLGLARRLATDAASRSVEALQEAHRRWWDSFWRRSSFVSSERMVETLWYQGIYLAACQCRGGVIPSTMGPGYYLPHGGWHADYITNYNVEMLCWPSFVSNHLELARVFFDYYVGKMDVMADDTRNIFGLEGVKVPGLSDPSGREIGYLPGRNWLCGSPWIAQLFWWGYTYSGDLEYLREKAYPFMREVTNFFRAYAELGKDGKYHLFPSAPPEQNPWWATDVAIDLTLLRTHLAATLEAAAILEVDHDLLPAWRDLLQNLAEAPVGDGLLLDHRDADPRCRLSHTALMCITWSSGEIGIGSPKERWELAVRSMHSAVSRGGRRVIGYPIDMQIWNDDCCWPNLVGYAARLGLPADARRYLYDYGVLQHLKPNGQFAFDCPLNDSQRETRWGMPDSNTAMTAAVSEMLIQSHDGVIRIGPAWPAEWDAEYDGFLAFGAFEVGATLKAGEVTRLVIRSLKGKPCRVANPRPGEAVTITTADGQTVSHTDVDGVLAFDTTEEATYLIRGANEPSRLVVTDEPAGPMRYTGPIYEPGVPAGQRIDVWVGLRPDGKAAASEER